MVGSLGVVLAVLCMPAQGSTVVAASTTDPGSTLDQMLSIPSGQSSEGNSVVTLNPNSSMPAYTYNVTSTPETSTGLVMPSPRDGQPEKMYIVTLGEGSNPNKMDQMAFGIGSDPNKMDHMAFGVLPKPIDTSNTAPNYTITLPPGTTLPSVPSAPAK